jgi:hypothetical protein
MSLEEEIKSILFQIGKDIKIHKIDSQNSIIEIDYDKYVNAIIDVINKKG